MSEFGKGRKVVNAIGIGIMAFLSGGTSVLQVSAAAAETENVGEALEYGTQANSQNQETIAAIDTAGNAINTAQGTVTDAGEIPNKDGIQGGLSGAAGALGKVDEAVSKLEKENGEAKQALKDYQNAVKENLYRDGAVENVNDAKDAVEAAQGAASESSQAIKDAAEENKAAQEATYNNHAEAAGGGQEKGRRRAEGPGCRERESGGCEGRTRNG